MRIPKRLEEARKVIADNTQNTEELIQQKLKDFRNLDIQGIVKEKGEFDKIIEGLSEEEKKQMDVELEKMASEQSGFLEVIADALEDPETRTAIFEELKRRAR